MVEAILSSYEWFDHPHGPKFVETHRDQFRTSGHWLFLPGVFSTFHKVDDNEEIWAIHQGRLHLHLLNPDGRYRQLKLGCSLHAGERPVLTVPAGCWQAAEIPEGEPYAWGTNVCAPPFSAQALTVGECTALIRQFPEYAALITRLTLG